MSRNKNIPEFVAETTQDAAAEILRLRAQVAKLQAINAKLGRRVAQLEGGKQVTP